MAWIHSVGYYIAGLGENIKVFSIPVLFDGHDNRASNRLALDHTIPLPDLPGGVVVHLIAKIKHRTGGVNQVGHVRAIAEIKPDIILQPPNHWQSTQISIAYQLVDALSLSLKKEYLYPEFQIIQDTTQLAPDMKRHYL